MSWIDQYRSKLVTAHEAVSCVESGMRVYIHPGCAEPEALVEALIGRAPFVKDVEVVHLLTMGTSPYCAPEMAAHFRHNALFVGGNVREAVNDGRADYTPIFLGEVEALFESGGPRPATPPHQPRDAANPAVTARPTQNKKTPWRAGGAAPPRKKKRRHAQK